MWHRHNSRIYLTAAVLSAALLAGGCQDTPGLLEPAAQIAAPPVAALNAAQAALLAVAVDDVIVRVIPHSGEEPSSLRLALTELVAGLPVADGQTLRLRLSATRAAIAATLQPVDADALILALDAIDRAIATD